ncbi:hypothetical protein B0T17DRAFT_589815 [Bombardia bombarda]|uniref:Uncharacterized protein n=1 Tax=Bombardia bombarda TaxID=252184 RepID=A0AA39XAA7_9PEZI|nr:hypothetical protein B0T17DRAFT_589815 [Bombardia bombarda]
MPALSTAPHDPKGDPPVLSIVLCSTVAVFVLIGICVARRNSPLMVIQESVHGRVRGAMSALGVGNEILQSIPVVRYGQVLLAEAGQGSEQTSDHTTTDAWKLRMPRSHDSLPRRQCRWKDDMQQTASHARGKKALKRFRLVYRPYRPMTYTGDAELGGTAHKNDDNNEKNSQPDDNKGQMVKDRGTYKYLNQFHLESSKFDDVAVYLSPTNSVPRRLVVQASGRVLANVNELRTGDWIRTNVRGNVPKVLSMAEWALTPFRQHGILAKINGSIRLLIVAIPLQMMLAIPGLNEWEDEEVKDTYTDYPGFHWNWPKYAVNPLDMAPGSEIQSNALLDVRRRAECPRKLVVKDGDRWVEMEVDGDKRIDLKYVFISYQWDRFKEEDKGQKKQIDRMAEVITERQGCSAYWRDERTAFQEDGDEKDYDIYTMCDVIRGSSCVAVMLKEDTAEERKGWGSRMWTLQEGLLAPRENILFCHEAVDGQLVSKPLHKVEMTSTVWARTDFNNRASEDATRLLAEHYSGLLTLSRLELLSVTIAALGGKRKTEKTKSDLAYAVMGMMRYRVNRNDGNTVFQNLARLSLGNDSDQLVERMLCLLPREQWEASEGGVKIKKPVFNTLTVADEYETHLHHITPLCQVVGVAYEDETVMLDNCRAIHIRWKDFPRATVQRDYGFKKLFAALFLAAGFWWLGFGVQMVIYYIPFWSDFISNVKVSLIAWLAAGFIFVGLLLSVASPFSVRRLFGGTVLKSSPSLVAFEGFMPREELEKMVFGNDTGRLTYAPSATPLMRDHRNKKERSGVEPEWIKDQNNSALPSLRQGHHIFTLVDMGELSVTIFTAERPPTVALLCGREGGMLRAVLCSWRFETDTLYKETVVRMPSRVYEAAAAKGWLKMSLKTQNEARRMRK